MGDTIPDYYEILGLNPSADGGLVDQAYRYLAKIYHPDQQGSADPERFRRLSEAHSILKSPQKRAEYDRLYSAHGNQATPVVIGPKDDLGSDLEHQNQLLQILYQKRRATARDPGVGEMRILRMIGCEDSELEFIVWYLKERGLIKLTEHGGLAITAQGVDYLISKHLHAIERLRLTDERATH